jgi:hypothetical protein
MAFFMVIFVIRIIEYFTMIRRTVVMDARIYLKTLHEN